MSIRGEIWDMMAEMKKGLRALVLVTVVLGVGALHADVLLWQINEVSVFGVGGVEELAARGSALGYGNGTGESIAARVRMTTSDGTESTYLNIYQDGSATASTAVFLKVDEFEGEKAWSAGPMWSGNVPEGAAGSEIMFAIELGAYNQDGTWGTLALSDEISYAALWNSGAIAHDPLNVQGSMVWTPTSFASPEPSSGLLVLLGAALLTLRRRRV